MHLCDAPLSPARVPRAGTARAPRASLTLLACLVVLLLTGCGVRLDVPPPPPPVPEGQDAVRQEAAVMVEVIAAAAQTAGAEAPEQVAPVLAAIGADAQEHLEALGGVWQPPPRPEPDDGPEPSEPDDAAASAGGADVLGLLDQASAQFQDQVGDVDGDLATVLMSIAVNQHLHARDLRTALDLEAIESPQAAEDPFPAALSGQVAPVVRILDARGYIAEVRAGRASGEEAAGLADRAARLRAQAELLATRAEISGTEDDPRQVAYELDLEDLDGQARELNRALVPAWLNLLADAEGPDRELIGTQVLLAARAVHGQGQEVPTFPGRAG